MDLRREHPLLVTNPCHVMSTTTNNDAIPLNMMDLLENVSDLIADRSFEMKSADWMNVIISQLTNGH